MKYLYVFCFLLVGGCSNQAIPQASTFSRYPVVEPIWHGYLQKIDMQKLAWHYEAKKVYDQVYIEQVEFSKDNTMVGVCKVPNDKADCVVFDLKGNIIREATGDDGYYAQDFRSRFFRTSIIASNYLTAGYSGARRRIYEKAILCNLDIFDLLKKSSSWRVSDDGNECLILVSAIPHEHELLSKNLELWQIKPEKKLLWQSELPESMLWWNEAIFFERDNEKMILISNDHSIFYISHKDGRVINQVGYSDITLKTLSQDRSPIRSVTTNDSINNSGGTWSPCMDSNSEQRLLAIGLGGRRVMIVSLDNPKYMVVELKTHWADDGSWSIETIRFAGGHFLIVKYTCSRRDNKQGEFYSATDIFDTRTWQLVWNKNSLNIDHVTLSPDGKKMAFIRGKYLEIGDFFPQEVISTGKK